MNYGDIIFLLYTYLYKSHDADDHEIGEERPVEVWNDMQGRSNTQNQLKLVHGLVDVTLVAETENLESRLQVEEKSEGELDKVESVPFAGCVYMYKRQWSNGNCRGMQNW